MRSRKKRLIVVSLVIILITIVVFVLLRQTGDDNASLRTTESDVANTTSISDDFVGSEKVANLPETLNQQSELDEYINEKENNKEIFLNIDNIDNSEIDWSVQKIQPVEFYAPAGYSVKNVGIEGSEIVQVEMLNPPEDCTYPAVQYKFIVFVILEKNEDIATKDKILVSYAENDVKCPL